MVEPEVEGGADFGPDESPVATVKRKIAIVGGGPSRKRAPFGDPSWEIWAFSSRRWRIRRIDRWFEIHAMTDLRQQLASKKRGRRRFGEYMRFMRNLDCPVYMWKARPAIPNSIEFPVGTLLEEFGRCFTSTAAYMIAMAIHEGCDVIGLWGIDLRGPHYRRQRPAIRYLLSVAKRRGIELVHPRGFSLRVPAEPRFVKTPVLYAYGWRSRGAWWRARLRRRARKRASSRR